MLDIRWLIRSDMPKVLDIDAACYPLECRWDEEAYRTCLRQRNCIGMAAEINNSIVGCMIYELHKDNLRIVNFTVDPQFWRQGIGTAMAQKLKDKLSYQRRQCITLEISEGNTPAQLFFKAQGFQCVEVARGFYAEWGDASDAYRFKFCIGDERRAEFRATNRISEYMDASKE